ncbi:hypothetical protein JRQ81_001463, partial [Phrynocephalus forsythii]
MDFDGAAVVICNTCAMFVILPKCVNYTYSKCKLVALLQEKVQQLEACISNQQQINELELFLDRVEQTIPDKKRQGILLWKKSLPQLR